MGEKNKVEIVRTGVLRQVKTGCGFPVSNIDGEFYIIDDRGEVFRLNKSETANMRSRELLVEPNPVKDGCRVMFVTNEQKTRGCKHFWARNVRPI